MRLEDYLEGIKGCEDPDYLTQEYGVYSGYPILLAGDISKLVDFLPSSNYEYVCAPKKEGDKHVFYYNPGIVSLHICSRETVDDTIDLIKNVEESNNVLFNIEIMLQWYSSIKSNENGLLLTSNVVQDLGRYILKNRIPSIFLNSTGWAHLDDDSRRVIYIPGGD